MSDRRPKPDPEAAPVPADQPDAPIRRVVTVEQLDALAAEAPADPKPARRGKMVADPELSCLAVVGEALAKLPDDTARARVLGYLASRMALRLTPAEQQLGSPYFVPVNG